MNVVQQLYMSILAAYMEAPKIPITCPTLELNEAISSFNFAATLSCSNDQLDGANSEIRPHVPIGGQCTYSYNCDFDAPNTTRQVTKTCQSNGKWSEEQPECTDSDELAQSILEVFGRFSPADVEGSNSEQTTTTEETSTESSTEMDRESSSSASSAERPNANLKKKSSSASKSLRRLCDSQKMCKKLRTLNDCPKIVPTQFLSSRNSKFNLKLFKVFTGLCYHCFKNYCSGPSVTLL